MSNMYTAFREKKQHSILVAKPGIACRYTFGLKEKAGKSLLYSTLRHNLTLLNIGFGYVQHYKSVTDTDTCQHR